MPYFSGGSRHIWEEHPLQFKILEVSQHGEKMVAKTAALKNATKQFFSLVGYFYRILNKSGLIFPNMSLHLLTQSA